MHLRKKETQSGRAGKPVNQQHNGYRLWTYDLSKFRDSMRRILV